MPSSKLSSVSVNFRSAFTAPATRFSALRSMNDSRMNAVRTRTVSQADTPALFPSLYSAAVIGCDADWLIIIALMFMSAWLRRWRGRKSEQAAEVDDNSAPDHD